MAVIVTMTTPNDEHAPDSTPRRIFQEDTDVELEVQGLVPVGEAAFPYFWVRGTSFEAFEQTLKADPEISSLTRVETVDGGALYTVEWNVDSPVIHCIAATDGALVEAHGTSAAWQLTILFNERRDAAAFHQCCESAAVPFEITAVRSLRRELSSKATVSAAQREALATAYERGYFEQPREATQEEIAAELGISATAVSDRIRRGIRVLVREHVVIDPTS